MQDGKELPPRELPDALFRVISCTSQIFQGLKQLRASQQAGPGFDRF